MIGPFYKVVHSIPFPFLVTKLIQLIPEIENNREDGYLQFLCSSKLRKVFIVNQG